MIVNFIGVLVGGYLLVRYLSFCFLRDDSELPKQIDTKKF